MRKKIIITICILLVICASFAKCVLDISKPSSSWDLDGVRGNLEYHWEEELPDGGVLKYEIDNVGGFPMDGATYAIIEYGESKAIDSLYDWEPLDNDDKAKINALLDQLTVEEKDKPDYTNLRVYKKSRDDEGDELFIMSEKGSKVLFVVENMY